MNQVSAVIKKFFEDYERASNEFVPGLLDVQFHDFFMNADANGVQVVKKADVLAAISKRRELFKAVGLQSTRLTSLEEYPLDEHYVMVKTQWHLRYEKTPGQAIDSQDASTFILYVKENSPRIVFYHPHQDIIKELRTLGLLPAV